MNSITLILNNGKRVNLKNISKVEYIPEFYVSTIDNLPSVKTLTDIKELKTLGINQFFYKFYFADGKTYEIHGIDLKHIILHQ